MIEGLFYLFWKLLFHNEFVAYVFLFLLFTRFGKKH